MLLDESAQGLGICRGPDEATVAAGVNLERRPAAVGHGQELQTLWLKEERVRAGGDPVAQGAFGDVAALTMGTMIDHGGKGVVVGVQQADGKGELGVPRL